MKNVSTAGGLRGESSNIAFVDVARRYCTLIERRSELSRWDLLREVQSVLAELYFRGLALRPLEPSATDSHAGALTHEEWWTLFSGLRDQLRDFDSYWVAHPEREASASPGASSLSDDLADVYRDLKSGFILWDAESDVDAVWGWRERFRGHWGTHVIDALGRLHGIVCEDEDGESRQDV